MTNQNPRILKLNFKINVILSDELFNKNDNLKKGVLRDVAMLVKKEAHRFIDAHSPEDLIKHAVIEKEGIK